MNRPFPPLTLVLGGASSGKSLWAEQLVLSANKPAVYLATAQAFDPEMQRKIEAHQARRGTEWSLFETAHDPAQALVNAPDNQVILLDCLTLWLSNLMHNKADIEAELTRLITALNTCKSPVVCVSNELGLGLVPDTSLGRKFRDWQGVINQRIAAQADLVTFVAAGLPMALKGELPQVQP